MYLMPVDGGHYYSNLSGTTPNYAITVTNIYGGTEVNPSPITQNAGTHKIIKAVLNIVIESTPYKDADYNEAYASGSNWDVYDGVAKYFKAVYALPGNLSTGIEPGALVYYSGTQNDHVIFEDGTAPKNHGSYYIEYILSDAKNYSAPSARKEYTIRKKTLAVTAKPVTNSASSSVTMVNGGYYFNGGNFTYGIIFGGLISGESSFLTYAVEKTLPEDTHVAAADKDAFMTFAPAIESNGFSFSVRNSGAYEVSVTLADRGAFIADNYEFASDEGGTDTYELPKFEIFRDNLIVNTKNTSVEYGYALGTIEGSKLGVTYVAENNSARTDDLISAEKAQMLDGKPYLVLPTAFNASMFESADYTQGSSKWGEKYDLTLKAGNITAYNFTVTPRGGNVLSIDAHKMTVEVMGYGDDNEKASCVYAGQNSIDGQPDGHNPHIEDTLNKNRPSFLVIKNSEAGFVAPSDYKAPLGSVMLRISINARNVGNYPLAPSQDKTAYPMYDISFVNAAGDAIYENLEDASNTAKLPTWYIAPAELKIAVGKYDASVSYDNLVRDFSVPYGTSVVFNDSALSTFSIRYSGWISGEGNDYGPGSAAHNSAIISACTVYSDKSSTSYAPWASIAGDVFTVTPVIGALEYTNYYITPVTATLRISALSVTATSTRVEYTERKDANGNVIYNGGKSGAEHDVVLTFSSAVSGIDLPQSGFAQFAYGVSYNTTVGQNANKTGGAPIVVGDYRATVSFTKNAYNAYNYIFADGMNADKSECTFDHEVYKKTVYLNWNEQLVQAEEDAAKTNFVEGYVADIMVNVSLTLNDNQVSDGFTVDANGFVFSFDASGVGTYRLLVRFNENAAKNYCWDTAGDDKIVSFSVVLGENIVVILDLSIDDWTYDAPMNEPTARLSFEVGGSIIYSYAAVNKSVADAILGASGNRVVPATTGNGLAFNATPINAGWYVVRASYTYGEVSAASTYYLFKIDRAEVDAPVLEIISTGEGKNDTYTGNRLSANVTHDGLAFVSTFAGDRSAYTGGTQLFVTNANESGYTIRFALTDYLNHKWSDAIADIDGVTVETNTDGEIVAVILTWKVAKADTHDIIWNDSVVWDEEKAQYRLVYGAAYEITARSTFSGSVRYAYAAGTDPDQVTEWSASRPANSGSYIIRAVCDGNTNYEPAEAYRYIVIENAKLTATPIGSIVYGDAFNASACDFILTGYVNSVRPAIVRDNTKIKYSLADGTLNPAALDAGSYKLVMSLNGDGFVAGVSVANYDIVLSTNGSFTVERKQVSVAIGNTSGVYLEGIDLTSVQLTVTRGLSGSLTTAEILETLDITLGTTASQASIVGRYAITATSANGNYLVSFTSGEYVVTELRVRVEISAGGGEYDGVIRDAVVTHIYTVNASEEKDLIGDDILDFSYRYSGRSYSGVLVTGTTRPTLAGMYIATVTGITNNDNYILDLSAGDVSVPFVIARKAINTDNIVIAPKPYTGSAVEPTISDDYYNVNGNTLYTVEAHDAFIDGGTYSLTLKLTDPDNYRWLSVEDGVAVREVSFTVTRAKNELIGEANAPAIKIEGWTFGQFDAAKNMPKATVKFDNEHIVYTYASHRDGPYTTAIPSDGKAGEYWVRVTVRETQNYDEFVSEPVAFTIGKLYISAPTLQKITEGEGKNDTYTGGELSSLVVGFDSLLMGVYYDGSVNINGSRVTVFAVNAGYYEVKISVKDPVSYGWAEGTTVDADGNAVLSWIVARKKIAKPTDNDETLIVNGKILQYFPDGFDEGIMTISGNKSGYGGTFTATVELTDTANYEWADGTDTAVTYTWQVVGSHTVFIGVASTLGGVCAALGVVAIVLFVRYRKKKQAEEIA